MLRRPREKDVALPGDAVLRGAGQVTTALASDAWLIGTLPSASVASPQELKRRVAEATRSQYAIHALDWIFGRPIFRSSDFIADAGIPAPTARRVLAVLVGEGILRRISAGRGRSPAVYAFAELVNRAEGRPVFAPSSPGPDVAQKSE